MLSIKKVLFVALIQLSFSTSHAVGIDLQDAIRAHHWIQGVQDKFDRRQREDAFRDIERGLETWMGPVYGVNFVLHLHDHGELGPEESVRLLKAAAVSRGGSYRYNGESKLEVLDRIAKIGSWSAFALLYEFAHSSLKQDIESAIHDDIRLKYQVGRISLRAAEREAKRRALSRRFDPLILSWLKSRDAHEIRHHFFSSGDQWGDEWKRRMIADLVPQSWWLERKFQREELMAFQTYSETARTMTQYQKSSAVPSRCSDAFL